MAGRRRSLRELNLAAFGAEAAEDEKKLVEEVADGAEPSRPQLASVAAGSRTRRRAASAGEMARIGIYLTPQEFRLAKAAYLADWTNGGSADTFARWVAAAVETHASRPPAQRVQAQPKERAEYRTGATKSFSVPAGTVTAMRAAITADQQAGRWLSDSAWCGEAIARAVEVARAANGGILPTPPQRLPNRLTR